MHKADALRSLAKRLSSASGKRMSVSPDSAAVAAQALEAYADMISRPIADYPTFTVDVWDDDGRLLETMAWTSNVLVGQAAFDQAVKERLRYEVTLRQGARVVAVHKGEK